MTVYLTVAIGAVWNDAGCDNSGSSVSLSANGETVAIGARYNNNNVTMMEMAVPVATSEFILSVVVHKLKSSSFFIKKNFFLPPRTFSKKTGAEVDLNFQTEGVSRRNSQFQNWM